MKRFSEQVSVKKTLDAITISEFRQRPGEVMLLVELGKTFVIKKNGRPVAVLSKIPGEQLSTFVRKNGIVEYKLES